VTPAPSTPSDGFFAPTRWTVIQRAQGDSAEARQALGELCEGYWTPVFRFLRGQGRDEDAAARLGMNEGALKVAIHRLRKRFREVVRAELAQTVCTQQEVDEELRYLVEVLSRGGE
jgi:hypothetical protein